jgi:hypothetical protein
MSIEATLGAKGSFDPFISETRPHIGQVPFFGFFTRLIELIFCLIFFQGCLTIHQKHVPLQLSWSDRDGKCRHVSPCPFSGEGLGVGDPAPIVE